MGREKAFGAGVRQIVTHVGEEGAARGEFGNGLGGALDGGMSGVRLVPEGVEKKDVEAAKLLDGFGGDLGMVGKISGVAEAKAVDWLIPVKNRDGRDG
jgi:hypothetical protein